MIEQYSTQPDGDGEILAGLEALQKSGALHPRLTESAPAEATLMQLGKLAGRLGMSSHEVVAHVGEAIERDEVDELARILGIGKTLLPVEQPNLYGGDPNVDETVRVVLHELRERFHNAYPRPKWMRLITSLVEIVTLSQHFYH